jgi:hypothetical protein
MTRSAFFTSENQQFQNRAVVNVRDPLHRGDAVTFQQQPQNQLGFIDRKVHSVQRGVASIREYLAALGALVALTIPALTKLAAVDPAIVTGHCAISIDRKT